MPDIGNTLREARISRELSLADVENITKIRSKYLQALEENDFEVLPGTTVVKGFLRSYAVFLKLDADQLLNEYRTLTEGGREDIGTLRTELSQQSRRKTSVERKKKRARRTQRGYIAAAVVAVAVIVAIAWLGAGRDKGGAVIGAENLPASTDGAAFTTVTVAAESTTTSTTSPSGTSTTAGVVATTGENVAMVVTVTEGSCWLVVRENDDGGADLYAGTLSAGGQQTFNGSKRYWLRVGAPEALSLLINGRSYTISGEAGTFLITETGIEREQTETTETTE